MTKKITVIILSAIILIASFSMYIPALDNNNIINDDENINTQVSEKCNSCPMKIRKTDGGSAAEVKTEVIADETANEPEEPAIEENNRYASQSIEVKDEPTEIDETVQVTFAADAKTDDIDDIGNIIYDMFSFINSDMFSIKVENSKTYLNSKILVVPVTTRINTNKINLGKDVNKFVFVFTDEKSAEIILNYFNQILNIKEHAVNSLFVRNYEIEQIAEKIAKSCTFTPVTLEDGSITYFIAVNFQEADNMLLINPKVLKATTEKLQSMQTDFGKYDAQSVYTLMNNGHIAGEMELHLLAYAVTEILGGELSPLKDFYNSAKIADLNITEDRFGQLIDIIGKLYF